MKKRIPVLILVMLIVINMMPMAVLAADPPDVELPSSGGTLIGGQYYLAGDVTLADNITIGGDVTLELNGYTLTGDGTNSESVITVNENATLTLYDSSSGQTGSVTGGKAGGVTISAGGNLVMNGGNITGNSSNDKGGGVNLLGDNAVFVMNGGSISGNNATNGGGVYLTDNATLNMNGGSIYGNTANNGGGVCARCEIAVGNTYIPISINMNGGSIYNNTATNGGGVYLEGSGTVNNYYTDVILNMHGGSIYGNTANNGGGMYCRGICSVDINNNSEISNNITTSAGGGISFTGNDNSKFTMESGIITGNYTDGQGGGIFINSSSQDIVINAGTIGGNSTAQYGGGVYIMGSAKVVMNGGNVTGNTAGSMGSGVFFGGSSTSSLSLGGTVVIQNNQCGSGVQNLYLFNNKFVTIGTGTDGTAAPATGMSVGITTYTTPVDGAPVQITSNGTGNDTAYFTVDASGNEVGYSTNGYLELKVADPNPDPNPNPNPNPGGGSGNSSEPPTVYNILAGANSTWTKGSTEGLFISSDASFDKFVAVKVDGNTVDKSYYKALAGSTEITFYTSYLETLSIGTHTVEITSSDGYASTSFTVKEAEAAPDPSGEPPLGTGTPKTGDDSNLILWGIMLLLGAGAFASSLIYRFKMNER